jgi:hypothetical protein
MDATVRGELSVDLNDATRRRAEQALSLVSLLARWILG